MEVRWLGNACVEAIKEGRNVLFDPNFLVDPKESPDQVFLSHEHYDHFDPQKFKKISKPNDLYGPKTALEKFDIEGNQISPGDTVKGVEFFRCDCYGSKESVCFKYDGILHTADTSSFPAIDDDVEIAFSACFKDKYDEYVEEAKKLDPKIVIPYHFDPETEFDLAKGLRDKLRNNGIKSEILEIGEIVELKL